MKASFILPSCHNKVIAAHIADLGEEGMCLVLKQDDEDDKLHEGDHLILIEIKEMKSLQFLVNIKMEVKWTLNVKHFAVGCEFLNVSQTIKEQIRQFVKSDCHRIVR